MKVNIWIVIFVLLFNNLKSQSFSFNQLNNALALKADKIEELPLAKKFKFSEAENGVVTFRKLFGKTVETLELFEYYTNGSGLTYCTFSSDFYLKIKNDIEKSNKYLSVGVNVLPDGRSINAYMSKDGKSMIQCIIESGEQNIYSLTFKKLSWTARE